ncbi:MAG: hypothetical protein NT075_24895 [Chloroflexi bacterium]|nr:hypothetical protein [Chloroflexota bacterium]
MPTLTPMPAKEMAGRATPQQPASPLPNEQPAAATNPISSTLTYRGETGYALARQYAVDYAAAQWQLIKDYDANPGTDHDERLQNRQEPACWMALFGGPMEMDITGQIELAGRKWLLSVGLGRIDQRIEKLVPVVVYMTAADDPLAGPIAYFLAVYLPPSEQPDRKSPCQQAAEQVIATFRIVDAISP